MLEEIYEDDLIGDPNDLDELIEQQGDALLDEAEEEEETEGNANNGTFLIYMVILLLEALNYCL
jgi:hypothetical protein